MTYADFLAGKRRAQPDAGVVVPPDAVDVALFPFQRDIVLWALRKGRAAVFADTGLGKSFMQVEWARLTGRRCLILAPLAVAQQTVREAARIGVDVRYCRDQSEVDGPISISNYERLGKFDPAAFEAVVLDESSVLKSFSGVTKRALIAAFKDTPYRLCCTATPAPNDLEELCNHADFLGVMKANEMRSTFFIADSRGEFMKYRLKRHAHGPFFRWLSSWACAVKKPSDLGYDDGGFELPPLTITPHFTHVDYRPEGQLFADGIRGIGEASAVRRASLADRVAQATAIVQAEPNEQWLLWCGLNDEASALACDLGAVNVQGADSAEVKANELLAFADGTTRVLVTKGDIAGFGMNFQRCARMIFVGIGYSYELYYQCLRRCYRFGQTRPVEAHVVLSDLEKDVYDVVLRKEQDAAHLAGGLGAMRDYTREALYAGTSASDTYEPTRALALPSWLTSHTRTRVEV